MDVLNEPSPQRKLGSMLLFAMDSSLRWNDENRPVQRSPMRTLLAALVLLLAFAGQAWAQGDGLNGSYWNRSEEHTSELQSLMRISYAVFCLKKKIKNQS